MANSPAIAPAEPRVDYEDDLYAWAKSNAELLRRGELQAIDAINIAEELEALARSQRRELLSRLTVLLMHLLKWQYQPELQSRSWRTTIDNQRDELADLLDENPSLKAELDAVLQKSFPRAVRKAVQETGIERSKFPEQCPWAFEQIMDEDFWPE